MKLTIKIFAAVVLSAALIGCQQNKRPASQPALTEIGQPETNLGESQQNAQANPENQPMGNVEPEPQPTHRTAERTGATPKLDGLNATYSERAGTLTVVVPGKILFATGSTRLKSESHKTLDKIIAAIKRQYSGHRVYVDGHTDSSPIKSGRWKNNHDLAAQRALAVADYLMAHGIHENDIVIRSYGAINPKRSAEASRRVEIVVVVR